METGSAAFSENAPKSKVIDNKNNFIFIIEFILVIEILVTISLIRFELSKIIDSNQQYCPF